MAQYLLALNEADLAMRDEESDIAVKTLKFMKKQGFEK